MTEITKYSWMENEEFIREARMTPEITDCIWVELLNRFEAAIEYIDELEFGEPLDALQVYNINGPNP